MEPKEFVRQYLHFARESEKKTGISAVFILAQAAIESGWGDVAPGNMFFGVKDTDGINGNEQLLRTTEYSRRSDLQFPVILSVRPVILRGQKYFKYRVKDYFRKYDTPGDCFDDHATFFFKNPRYRLALGVLHDPVQFAIQVAKAGYATDPAYQDTLIKVIRMIEVEIDKLEKPWARSGK
jgi:flagellum-specific peptidoglycan hydrolase FlgJ